jgi:hypothetical protein
LYVLRRLSYSSTKALKHKAICTNHPAELYAHCGMILQDSTLQARADSVSQGLSGQAQVCNCKNGSTKYQINFAFQVQPCLNAQDPSLIYFIQPPERLLP